MVDTLSVATQWLVECMGGEVALDELEGLSATAERLEDLILAQRREAAAEEREANAAMVDGFVAEADVHSDAHAAMWGEHIARLIRARGGIGG